MKEKGLGHTAMEVFAKKSPACVWFPSGERGCYALLAD